MKQSNFIFLQEIPKKKKFSTYSMDIIFDKELTQEEMEKLLFSALRNIGVIGHRGGFN